MVESKEALEKIKILNCILEDCLEKSKKYKKLFKKLKKYDDMLDFLTAILSGTAISMVVAGFTIPPCLLASAVISGVDFVIKRGQDNYNFKAKYTQHSLTMKQYQDLAREIQAILSKNNMSSMEYQKFIEECYSKISLIEDTELF